MLLRTMRYLRRDKRGISNVIVVMLSLVLVVIIVSNVILSSYQMNQFDWERMQENVEITNVARLISSSWSVAQSEYAISFGTHVSGSYIDTQAVDGRYETFMENASGTNASQLGIVAALAIDPNTTPLTSIRTLEVQLYYRVNDSGANWYLKAFNWTLDDYWDNGFNSTSGNTPTTDWNNYTVNLTDEWRSYLRNDGTIYVEIQSGQTSANQTSIDIDFLGVRALLIGSTTITFRNKGSVTAHLVSLWVDSPTIHRRYDMNLFINAGDSIDYASGGINLVDNASLVKIITERGTASVFKVS